MEQPTSPLGGGESEMDFSMSVCSPEAMAYSLFEDRDTSPPVMTTAEVPICTSQVPVPPPPPLPPVPPQNAVPNRTPGPVFMSLPIVTIPQQNSMPTPTIIQVQQIQQVPQQTRLTLQPIQTQTLQPVQHTITQQQWQQLTIQQQAQIQQQLQQQLQQQGLRIQGQTQLVLTPAQNQSIVQLQQQPQQPPIQQQQPQPPQQQQQQSQPPQQQQQQQGIKLLQNQRFVMQQQQQLQTVQQQLQHKKQQQLQMQQAQIAQQGQQIQVQQPGQQQIQIQHQQRIQQQQQLLQQQLQQQKQLQQQLQQQLLHQQQQQQQQKTIQEQHTLQQQQQQQQLLHQQLQHKQQELFQQQQQQQQQLEEEQQQIDLQELQQEILQEAGSPQHSVEDMSITEDLEKKKDAYMTKKQKQKRSKTSKKSAVVKELEKQDKKLLALRLKLRRPREELVSQGIMPPLKASPGFHERRQRLERAKLGDSLQRKIRLRPEKSILVNQHILADTHVDPLINATQQRLKRSRLEQDLDSKIKNRPGPLELIEGNILKAEHLVEQAVKDGKVKFLKTNSIDSPFEFDEDSQEAYSDEALSPSQSEISQAESQPQQSLVAEHHSKNVPVQPKQQQQLAPSVVSPFKTISPRTSQTFIAIKQEPGLISPPPVITSNTFTPISAVSNLQLGSSGKVTPSPRQPRKKQTKRPKPKEIKFHEYKPPNEQVNKVAQVTTVSNPYNLLLMQQQLYLQLQLLQQQQRILPNTANPNKNTSSASSLSSSAGHPASITSTHTTSKMTPTTTAAIIAAAPAVVKQQPDAKPVAAAAALTANRIPRILTNLEDMKVSELKLELKNRGLHVSGTKPQLMERLRLYAEQTTAAATSSSEVATSTASVTSSTRVSSSTDLEFPYGDAASAPSSLSTPPISPEYHLSLSVPSEPMSPGSAFDPMSPSTFQGVLATPVCSPDTVSTTNLPSSATLARNTSPFEQATLDSPQQLLPPLTTANLLDSFNGTDSDNMMDVSTDGGAGSQLSTDLLRQQQLKIQELEHMLQLSQMQLQMQQLQQQPLSPLTISAPGSIISPTAHQQQHQQSTSLPSSSVQMSESPQNDTAKSGFMFHSQDYAHTLNQQPKVFSFASPPPNGQPFLFTKQHEAGVVAADAQGLPLANGIMTSPSPKAASLPTSPTERNILGVAGGMTRSVTQPTFANPPPNYEEAVRQAKERKSQGNSPVSGSPVGSPPKENSTGGNDIRSTKCQDLDDLLEVLVDHGYQIPLTPKFKDIQRSLQNSTQGLATTVTQSIIRGRGGSLDLKLPVPGPSPPPPPMSQSYSPSIDLPMEVDSVDMPSLDLVDSSMTTILCTNERGACRTQSVPFDVPMTTVDGCDTPDHSDPGPLGSPAVSPDLNWLDLVMQGSSGGNCLTPAGTTPPMTGFGVDAGAFGSTLGKDFPLNLLDLSDISTPTDLHHLEDDVWDNIPVTE